MDGERGLNRSRVAQIEQSVHQGKSQMIAKLLQCAVLGAVSCAAWAQSADCPKRGVPMPSRPPEITQALPQDAFSDAEEGHVSAMLTVQRWGRAGPLPAPAAGIASSIAATPLARWSYLGYLPE